jgi:hypothetical protein
MRVLLTVLTVLAVLSLPLVWGFNRQQYLDTFAGHLVLLTISAIVTLAQYALNAVAVVLINTPTARDWFIVPMKAGPSAA